MPTGLSKVRTQSSASPSTVKRFRDYNEYGYYEGDLDAATGERCGAGRMSYDSGNRYEGAFVDDKFEGAGRYEWGADGDVQEGAWAAGERQGVSVFTAADGTAEYSTYDAGKPVGEGVQWVPDRRVAHRLVDGERREEVSLAVAEELAKDKFNLPVPAAAEIRVPVHAPLKPSSAVKTGVFARLFSSRAVGPDGKILFKDMGDWGAYEGEVDAEGRRQGRGRMIYESGCQFDGPYVDNRCHGDKGVYRWSDGDEYDGSWKDGERKGIGAFKSVKEHTVEYSIYDNGSTVGESLSFNTETKIYHLMKDSKKKMEITLEEAKKLCQDRFHLPVPTAAAASASSATPSSATASSAPAAAGALPKEPGFLGRYLAKDGAGAVGRDGKLRFKDNAEWGTYEGDLDPSGKMRQGRGVMTYQSGNAYDGLFAGNAYHGPGTYKWLDGDACECSWKDGERDGVVILRYANGETQYDTFENAEVAGDSLLWSADRSTAFKMVDGDKRNPISPGMAQKMARDKFDLPVPPAYEVAPKPPSLLGRLLSYGAYDGKGVVGPDGKLQFRDYHDWGTYEGDLDPSGTLRQGRGVMTYITGNVYAGAFADNKFNGPATFTWSDGDEYEGAFKDGERHGIGKMDFNATGEVHYSTYENGAYVGDGVAWNAARTVAHKLLGEKKQSEISLKVAEKMAADKFGLPVPPPHVARVVAPGPSLLGRVFSRSSSAVATFEDDGDKGAYFGALVDGKRHGFGKMIYDSGNSYEGDFFENQFQGGLGTFKWSDGTEYEGSWKAGKFDGMGIFRSQQGVDYSLYQSGYATGVGVACNTDSTKAYHTLDGNIVGDTTLDQATELAMSKFNLPLPGPKKQAVSGLVRFFRPSTVGPDGKPRFKDHNDWGTYTGKVDGQGRRQGLGRMAYDSGHSYDGPFLDDKFHGDKGSYKWFDGDEFVGAWADGDRHGDGVYDLSDGTVSYEAYTKGKPTGTGVVWTPDRTVAHKTVDGVKPSEISLSVAEELAKELFKLPVPKPAEGGAKAAGRWGRGLFGRMFSSKQIGPDGNYFKDLGDWGKYDGALDGQQRRQGPGTMAYECGGSYVGPFADDRYHGAGAVYRWADGCEYRGAFREGERDGIGTFVTAEGRIEFERAERGVAGAGLSWDPDLRAVFRTEERERTCELTPEEAAAIAREEFRMAPPTEVAVKK